jgi:hypothetical protein
MTCGKKQTKVISTKVSVDNYNRFNILTEYLYKNGLIESHTPSALLRANIDYLLTMYHNKLEEYSANSTTSSLLALQPSSSLLLSQEPKEQSESDKEENYVGELILEGIQSKYCTNYKYSDGMDKEHETQERTERAQMLPHVSSELQDKIDELVKNIMDQIEVFDKIYEVAKKEDYPIDEIIEDKERLKKFLMI